MTEPRHPAFEAAIIAALVGGHDATEEFRAYGDWLQERGHVRGELVVRQCAGSEYAWLLDQHRHVLVGPVVDLAPELVELDWRCGFLRGAKLGDVGYVMKKQKRGIDQASALRDLVASPAARFLESLETACPWCHEDGVDTRMHEALREAGPFPTLRRLAVVSEEQNSFVMAGDFAHLSTTFPNLRELAIRAGVFELGAGLALPRLEALAIETVNLRPEHLAAIGSSRLPALAKLVLWFGARENGIADLAHVAPLLDDVDAFPALVHLGLCNLEFTDELVDLLATSRMLRRLEVLDLSKGTLGDDGARALAANSDRFAHLRTLVLAENFIATPEILRGFPVAITGLADQRLDELEYTDRRYAAVVE